MTEAIFLNANFPKGGRLTPDSYHELNTNIGNAYIAYSLFKILGLDAGTTVIENTIWKRSPNLRRLAAASEGCPWVFVNLQDQLRTSFSDEECEAAIEILNALNPAARMVAFSLSANSMSGFDPNLGWQLSPIRRRFFDLLAERCLSIGVRGPYTAHVLRSIGITNVAIVGCPSYFERGQGRMVTAPQDRAHVAALGVTGAFNLPSLYKPEVYMQGDAEWPWISLLHADDGLWEQQNKSAPTLKDPIYQRAAIDGRLHFFADFAAWQRHIAENCRLVCGSRLHGAIMALNAGVPAVVTSGDARARDTCEFLGIPWQPNLWRIPTGKALMEAANPARVNALYEDRRKGFITWLNGLGLEVIDAAEGSGLPTYEKQSRQTVVTRVANLNILRVKMDTIRQLPDSIYPDVRHPYYIVAPRYIRTSAGVRVLHLLCHALNRRGHAAYVLIYPAWFGGQISPDLLTPILTPQVAESHFQRGFVPIMVYPETIVGNPFAAPCVVRYVLNFPGLLGGDKEYAPGELIFSYSKTLAEATRSPNNILFLPATDTRIFRPPPEGQKRQGSCFYASKYRLAHGGELFDITKDSIEITRDLPNSQTPQEIAELFRHSEVFYAYENTALAIEAVLCGCPAVFLPNPYLNEVIAVRELGAEGYAWGANEAEVKRARETVAQGADNYLRSYKIFWNDLDHFIDLTQKHAEGRPYNAPLHVPAPTASGTASTLIRERGLLHFIRLAARKARKILSGYSVQLWHDTPQ